MKNLNVILNNADLRPKERIMMLIRNAISRETTGKEILTKSDKHSIGDAWKARNDNEVSEWNKYRKGWEMESGTKLDAQTTYLNAQISLQQSLRIIDYILWTFDDETKKYNYKIFFSAIDENEALELILKNSGLELDGTIYRYTMTRIDKNLLNDILALFPDAENESQYLNQEEILAKLFNGKSYLTAEEKNKLTDLIIKKMSGIHSDNVEDNKWWYSGYFAELPFYEIAKKYAEYNGVGYTDKEDLIEKINSGVKDKGETLNGVIRQTLSKWLDCGLFISEYSPLCTSDGKETINNRKTQLAHKDILRMWLEERDKTKGIIDDLIKNGQLEIETRERKLLKTIIKVKILTGESLYKTTADLPFITDYKKQTEIFILLGLMIFFLCERDFLNGYANLLAFRDIYKKLSSIYEIDMNYRISGFIEGLNKYLDMLKMELTMMAEKIEDVIFMERSVLFPIQIFTQDMLKKIDVIEPKIGETETFYINEFKEIFKNEFDI